MAYTFRPENASDKPAYTSKICNIIDGFADYGNQFALTYGKIKALFGKPLFETENMEELVLSEGAFKELYARLYNL